MQASDTDITALLTAGTLQVTPTEPELLQPASIELRLATRFATFRRPEHVPPVIDPAQDQSDLLEHYEPADGEPFVLPALGFALGSVMEHISVAPSLVGQLEGKSSLGRLGLFVHITAGFIDPGFSGHLTLEFFNASPFAMKLWPGMKVVQLAVAGLHNPASRPYGAPGLGSRYQDQPAGPQASQSFRGFRTWPVPATV